MSYQRQSSVTITQQGSQCLLAVSGELVQATYGFVLRAAVRGIGQPETDLASVVPAETDLLIDFVGLTTWDEHAVRSLATDGLKWCARFRSFATRNTHHLPRHNVQIPHCSI